MNHLVRVGGYRPWIASWSATLVLLFLGFLLLFRPLLWSLSAPNNEMIEREFLIVGGVAVAGLAVLAVALWKDSDWDVAPLGIAAALIALNAVIRALFNVSLGVEFNYVVPFLAGMAAGGPFGFFVGAASCLLSQLASDFIAVPLPGQMLVWGLAGIFGGFLRPLNPRISSFIAPFLGLVFGVGAGVLLNLIGWPTNVEASPRFMAGMPFGMNVVSLVTYTMGSSWGVDLMRGLCTAFALALAVPLLGRALLQALSPPLVDRSPMASDLSEPKPEAIARRNRARELTPWEKDRI